MTVVSIGQTATLVYGYTMADVDTMTRHAIVRARARGFMLDVSDRWDCAWHAIVEHLYSSAEGPSREELISEACRALARAVDEELHHHGINAKNNFFSIGPNALKYWLPLAAPGMGFEEKLIEHTALPQILAELTPDEYEALAATAVYANQAEIIAALGITRNALETRLASARRKFIALWLEHETPRSGKGDDVRCKAGHLRAEHSTRNAKGNWRCNACQAASDRRYRARQPRGQRLTTTRAEQTDASAA